MQALKTAHMQLLLAGAALRKLTRMSYCAYDAVSLVACPAIVLKGPTKH